VNANAVHRDVHVETCLDFTPGVRAILERIARCAYMVDMHCQGMALNSTRTQELRAELERRGASR
jgi:hypothetical protein